MKIAITERKKLSDSLTRMCDIVENRNTSEALANVYLQAVDNMLTIKATDLEISMESSILAEVIEPGNVSVPAKNFRDIVRELPDRKINISSKENHWISIDCGSSNFDIAGGAPEEYPSLPNYSRKGTVPFRVDFLKTMLEQTMFAVSSDETRYHLNGVFLEHAKKSRYRMVATDGHRLAYCEKPLFETPPKFLDKGIIVPRKGAKELLKLLPESKEWFLSLEENHLIFSSSSICLYVRLIEGNFPDYKQVVPKNNPNELEIDGDSFSLALKRVSLLANEKSNGIKLSIKKNQLEISTNNPDIGQAKENLEINYNGNALDIGFNVKYLMDSIYGSSGKKVTFSLNDQMSPGVIQIVGDNDYFCVLMPVRF